MRKFLFCFLCLIVCSSHDLFLKMDNYKVEPQQQHELALLNGTFDKSENSISRDRILQPQVLGPDYKFVPTEKDWYDKGKATYLKLTTGASGTYLAGVSTKPRMITLSAADFNEYLEHDGVLDVLKQRRASGRADQDAREKYSKHVKAVFQVGKGYSEHYKKVLSYPVEFVLQENPYRKKTGDKLSFQLLKNDQPLVGQLVYYGFRPFDGHHHHDEDEEHHHDEPALRTDADGKFEVELDHKGIWYLRTIHMVESEEAGVDYESNWATLTFGVY